MSKNPFPSDPSSSPATPTSPRERRQRVQAAETGVAVLKGLRQLGGRASITLLAEQIGESPAKVHRYLASLMEGGLVAQDSTTQQYYLGLETILLGLAAMRQADPIRLAEPALIRLREGLGVTCFIAVMGNMGPTIVRFEEPGLPVTVNVRIGSVLSMLWSATGRVFLSLLDDVRVRELAEAELLAAPADLHAQLDAKDPIGCLRQEIRRTQCASVRDTNLKGISAVSAPLFDHTGRPCAVLSALGASGGFDASVDGSIALAVRREAAAVSALLGFQAS